MALGVAAVEAAVARLAAKVITQVSRAVPAVLMAAVEAEVPIRVTARGVQSALFGPVLPVHSHRQTLAIFNQEQT